MSEESQQHTRNLSSPATPTLDVVSPNIRSPTNSRRKQTIRRVSFPEEETQLVTGYLEPANPWEYAENVNRDDLISTYKSSCEKHRTPPLDGVLKQLESVELELDRNECLNLKGENLEPHVCESLEEVLKRVQFKTINLEGTSLEDEGSVALFDMIEYYESATHLNISSNKSIGARGWQACSRMLKKTRCLEHLDVRDTSLNEQHMPILSRALRLGTHLQVLHLEKCSLAGRPLIILAAALKLNTTLKELYLADNNLGVTDAVQLCSLLRCNVKLQLLDVSNNNIQDAGAGHLCDGISEQVTGNDGGLQVLILWNNHLTKDSASHFSKVLRQSNTLETLNVGHNNLTNESIYTMKNALLHNRSLTRFGMQSTQLSCEGAVALAEFLADNPVIQRVDLRDNNIQVAGLMALSLSMKVNKSVNQLDLDDKPKAKESDEMLEQYSRFLDEIREYCYRNHETIERKMEITSLNAANSRKISLTCETLLRNIALAEEAAADENGAKRSLLSEPRRRSGRLRSPAPSPIPSPVSSPVPSPSRSRFQVSRVSEASAQENTPSLSSSPTRFFPSSPGSRFKVTIVEPSRESSPSDPSPPQSAPPVVTSVSGNITVGFNFEPVSHGNSGFKNIKSPSDTILSKFSEFKLVDSDKEVTSEENSIVDTGSSSTSGDRNNLFLKTSEMLLVPECSGIGSSLLSQDDRGKVSSVGSTPVGDQSCEYKERRVLNPVTEEDVGLPKGVDVRNIAPCNSLSSINRFQEKVKEDHMLERELCETCTSSEKIKDTNNSICDTSIQLNSPEQKKDPNLSPHLEKLLSLFYQPVSLCTEESMLPKNTSSSSNTISPGSDKAEMVLGLSIAAGAKDTADTSSLMLECNPSNHRTKDLSCYSIIPDILNNNNDLPAEARALDIKPVYEEHASRVTPDAPHCSGGAECLMNHKMHEDENSNLESKYKSRDFTMTWPSSSMGPRCQAVRLVGGGAKATSPEYPSGGSEQASTSKDDLKSEEKCHPAGLGVPCQSGVVSALDLKSSVPLSPAQVLDITVNISKMPCSESIQEQRKTPD